jgi:hypothetical protein
MKYVKFIFLFHTLIVSTSLLAQIQFISPLPNAIIEKNGNFGLIRFQGSSAKDQNVSMTFVDSLGKAISGFSDLQLSFKNGVLDSTIPCPVSKKFSARWKSDLDSGTIDNLAVGHLFAIAGQSNAQGWSPPPFITPIGDIRMLRNDSSWQKGEDPTGGMYASPWIGFANRMQQLLQDSLPIGLINVAVGGTSLVTPLSNGRWVRNDTLHEDTATLYGKALIKFLEAGSRFDGIFWIQGETDANGVPADAYVSAFKQLVMNFREDLKVPFQFFHLQIGGQVANPDKINWGIIREAHRTLPLSILVGTAVGNTIGWDGIHYSATAEMMVGDRFAGAIAKEVYHLDNPYYPPMLPQNSISMTQCTSKDPYSGYKIVLECRRNGLPVILKAVDTVRGFQIRINNTMLDTSEVFSLIESADRSKVDIFSKNTTFSPSDEIQLSYAITGDVSSVNVSDDDTSTTLPNYLVGFRDMQVLAPSSVPVYIVGLTTPNPFTTETAFSLYMGNPEPVSYSIYDISGKEIYSLDLGLMSEGKHIINLKNGHLAGGVYEIVVTAGNTVKTFKIVVL